MNSIGRKYTLFAGLLMGVMLLAACGGDSGEPEAGASEGAQRGEALYDEKCASCHGGDSGGEISDSPPPHNANGHTWHHADWPADGHHLAGRCSLGRRSVDLRDAGVWG